MDHYPLQDSFLSALHSQRVPVAIYLLNGIKLQGEIESFDQFAVLLKAQANQLIYKHLISTMIPARAVRIWPANKASSVNSPE